MKVFIQERRQVWELTRIEVEVPDGTPPDQVLFLAHQEYVAGRGYWATPVFGSLVEPGAFEHRIWWEGKPKP